MRKAIVLTAYNRPDYLADVLDSWEAARGIDSWDFYISIDETDTEEFREVALLANFFQQKKHANTFIIRHKPKLGVLKHPYVVMDSLFSEGYDFVLRAEDDLVVSDGILEYFDYVARSYKDAVDVKTVHGFSETATGLEQVIIARHGFNPWVFGTWKRAWPELKENWDLDYSTYNGTPGNQSGFDWNFNTRVYPRNNWLGIHPSVSRVQNIGAHGVHGTPENLPKSPTFIPNNEIREGHFELQL
jgi:hypothetical protein